MTRYIYTLCAFFMLSVFAIPAQTQEATTVFDQEIYWEWPTSGNDYGGYGFYWWHRKEGVTNVNYGNMSQTDWISPKNYYQGEFILRFEVLDQPTSDPFYIQFGIWQDKAKGSEHPETVSSRNLVTGGDGSVFEGSLESPSGWWNKESNDKVDFSRPEDFYRMGIVLWNADPLCIPMGTDWSSSGCPEYASRFFPMRARVRVIAYPAAAVPEYTITFTVRDENANPLPDAQVYINGAVLTTNTDGQASIRLENGEYSYLVARENFTDETGIINLYNENLSKSVTLKVISGINELTAGNVFVYPNPGAGNFILHSPSSFPKGTKMEVYDLSGKQIHSIITGQSMKDVPLSLSVPKGIYILKVDSGNSRITKKLVIQ